MSSLDSGSLHNRTSIADAIVRLREPEHHVKGRSSRIPFRTARTAVPKNHAPAYPKSAREIVGRDNRASGLIGTIKVLYEGERMLNALGYQEHARILAKIRIDIGELKADRNCRG